MGWFIDWAKVKNFVELEKEVVHIKTGERAELSEEDQYGEEITKDYIRKTLIINIQKGKTGARKAVGRLPSVNCCQFRSTTKESFSIVNHCSNMG